MFGFVRVFRVPWPNTRITRNNFGYRGLKPGLGFGFFGLGFFGFGLGFFGLGFRVSGILPSHTNRVHNSPIYAALQGLIGRFGSSNKRNITILKNVNGVLKPSRYPYTFAYLFSAGSPSSPTAPWIFPNQLNLVSLSSSSASRKWWV